MGHLVQEPETSCSLMSVSGTSCHRDTEAVKRHNLELPEIQTESGGRQGRSPASGNRLKKRFSRKRSSKTELDFSHESVPTGSNKQMSHFFQHFLVTRGMCCTYQSLRGQLSAHWSF